MKCRVTSQHMSTSIYKIRTYDPLGPNIGDVFELRLLRTVCDEQAAR